MMKMNNREQATKDRLMVMDIYEIMNEMHYLEDKLMASETSIAVREGCVDLRTAELAQANMSIEKYEAELKKAEATIKALGDYVDSLLHEENCEGGEDDDENCNCSKGHIEALLKEQSSD